MAMPALVAGAVAGCVATAPMTVAMTAMHRLLPRAERYPLPPSEITAEVSKDVGLDGRIDEREHIALTMATHFAFGTTAGAIYGPVARRVNGQPLLSGIGFALLVWTVSYLGWLPAFGILRPATEHPARRNALMIAAHVIWGCVTGLLTARFQR